MFQWNKGTDTISIHTIQVEATWMVAPSDSTALIVIESPSVEIEVFNEVSFPNWSFFFGELYDSLLINAVSAHPEVDWEVAIFDSQDQYVGSFFGRSTDGQIRVVWNLIDPFGVRREDPWFDADIYTWWDGGEAAASAPGSKAEVRMVYGSRSSGRAGLESGASAMNSRADWLADRHAISLTETQVPAQREAVDLSGLR